MLFLIGFIIILFSIVVGFIAEGGKLEVLFQPYSVMIILGSALGVFIVSNSKPMLLSILRSLPKIKKGHPYHKEDYLELLVLMYFFFRFVRTKNMMEVEHHIEHPYSSNIFAVYPNFLEHTEAVTFLCDHMRILVIGFDNIYELENMIEDQMHVRESYSREISSALYRMGDTLPALGIVAALLGVVNAMSSIGAASEILGHKVASALTGTFFGIAAAYCIFIPLGAFLEKFSSDEAKFLQVIKAGLISFAKGSTPTIAIEFARQAIPMNLKPDYQEVETQIENKKIKKKK